MKISRIVKRRSVAQEMIEVGAVRLNGHTAKSSASVKIDDTVEVAFPSRVLTVKVMENDEAVLKRGRTESFSVVSDVQVKRDDRPWQI